MFPNKIALKVLCIFLLVYLPNIKAQAFGFGCLGFVGGYGGYSYQDYDPQGLNSYVVSYNELHNDSLSSPLGKFGKATGYRVGINFFRANIEGFILTTKGFYQSLREKQESSIYTSAGETSTVYDLEIKNWGVGIDLGTTITSALSWKVIDAALLYNFATLTRTANMPGAKSQVKEFNNTKPTFGYSIGTGFILAVIDDYVSLEGVAGYSVFKIDQMQLSDGTLLKTSESSQVPMHNFINSGGFNAVIQLNIGFPL